MSKRDDDHYAWLDDHAPDPRESAALPPPPPPPPPPFPETSPLPAASPDGSITYTSSGPTNVAHSYGQIGTTAATDPGAIAPYQTPPKAKRSTGIGSAGKRTRRGGFLGFLGRVFKIRLILGIIGLAIAGVLALFGVGGDTTSVGSLDPGDCFELVTETRVRRVTVQDCALPHNSEVYAEVRTFDDELVGEMCFEEFFNLGLDFESLPPDAEFSYFEGTLTHRCIVESASGQLVGSILD